MGGATPNGGIAISAIGSSAPYAAALLERGQPATVSDRVRSSFAFRDSDCPPFLSLRRLDHRKIGSKITSGVLGLRARHVGR